MCLIYGSLFNAERRGAGDPSVLINLLKAKKSFNDILRQPPDGWQGEHGFVTKEILERYLPANRKNRDYFVVGPIR